MNVGEKEGEERKEEKKNLSQKKRSKEASRARTASGPGRWCFILYVCKTQRHCVTHAIRFLHFFFVFYFFKFLNMCWVFVFTVTYSIYFTAACVASLLCSPRLSSWQTAAT